MILNKAACALHHTTKKTNFPKKQKKFSFSMSKSTCLAKEIVKEIVGKTPYELCAIDMIKKNQDKKVKKFLRKRLGSLRRAKRKIDRLTTEIHQ